MKKIYLIICFFSLVYSQELDDKKEFWNSMDCKIDKNSISMCTYVFDFDKNNINDLIIIDKSNCTVSIVQNNQKKVKYKLLDTSYNTCNDTWITENKHYLHIGEYSSDFGNAFIFKYNVVENNWYLYGSLEKYKEYKKNIYDFTKASEKININKYMSKIVSIFPQKQSLYKTPNKKTKMYLIKDDKVEILKEKDDWLYILYKGKKDIKAWIPKSSVE